ncbi:phage tail tape measure protein [Treponema sp.]|uniref:phage tail tape measure protein n=1 Tax=Treponema sp. TaxID=166 RepID=UPI003FA279B4
MGQSLGELYAELALKTDKLQKGISESNRSLAKLEQDIDKTVESINAKLAAIGTALSASVTLPLTLLGKAALDTFTNFEQSMQNTFSVMGATASEMEALRKKAENMGASTRFSASQAADALYSLGSAGQTAAQAMNSLDGVLQLAGATGSDLAFTSSTIASTLSQFHLSAEKSAHIADVFSLAISKSQANMTKLSYSMKYVGPVAAGLGVSLEASTAALMRLYNTGFGGEQAGTILRSGLQKLASGTDDVKKKLEALGVSYDEVNPKTNNLADIIQRLKDANIDVAKSSELFGEAAAAGMQALIEGGGDAIRTMDGLLQASDGAAKKMQDIQNASFANTKAELSSAFEAVQITLTSNIIPAVDTFAKGITRVLQAVNELPVGVQISGTAFAALAAAAGPLLLVAVGIKKIQAEMVQLNLVMSANPIIAWGAAVAAAGAIALGIIAQVKKAHEDAMRHAERQLEQAKALASDALQSGDKGRNIQELLGKYDSLKGKIHDSKEAQSQFNSVIEQLAQVVPGAQGALQAQGESLEQFVIKARNAAREALELEKTKNERALILSKRAANEAQKYVSEHESKLEHSFKTYSQDLYRANKYEHILEQFKTAQLQGEKEQQAAITALKEIEHFIKKDAGDGFSFASFSDAFGSLQALIQWNTKKLSKDEKALLEQQRLLDEQKAILTESKNLQLKIETGAAALKQLDSATPKQKKHDEELARLAKEWEAEKKIIDEKNRYAQKMGESFSVPQERIKFLQAKLKELIAIKPEDIDTIFTLDSKGLQQYFDAIAQEQAKLEKGKGTKKTSNKEKDTSYQAQIAELDKFYQEKLAKAKEYGQSSLAVEKEYQEKRLALIEQFIKEEDKKKGAGKGIGVETKSAATNEKGSGVTLGDELTKTKLMSDAFGRYQAQQKELQAELKKTQEEIIATHDKIAKTKALLEAAKKNNTSGREIKTLNQDLQAMQAYFQQLEEKAQNIRVEINEAELSFSNIKSGLNDIEKIGKSKLQIQLINIEEERKRLLKIIEENRRAKIAAAKDNAEEIARIEADAKKQQNTVNKDADRQQQDAKAAAANAYVQGGIGIAKSLTKVIADSIEQGGLDGFAALQASSEILDQIGNMVGDATAQAVIKSVAAAIEITGMILKAVSAANVKAFEKEVQTIVDSTKKNADEAAQKIVDDIHKSIVDQSQAPMKEAATSLLQAITNGFQSGDFTNFSKSIDDIIKKLVVEKMVMFSGLQGAIEKLVNNMFSGFKGSGAQQINALKQEQEPLKQEMEATKKEYDAYQKLVRLRDEGIRQQSLWYHQRTGHYAGLWEKDVKKEVTKLNGEIAKLEGTAARYKAAQEKLANLNEQIKAINPNEKADLTQIKKMDKDELKRLAEEYGEPIKELFKMLGVDTGEGFQKALTDSMSSALTSSLGDAAYNADWGSFKKSFAAEMKKAIIQSAMQSAGIKAKVDSLIQGILADGKVTSEEVNGTINALKPLYDRLEKMMAEVAGTTKALEGGVEVKTQAAGTIIQQLSGADRDVLLEAIKNGFSTINQSIDLKDATIQHLAATQIIINAVTFNSYNGTVNIYADKAISLQDLVQEITKEMIARG